MSKSLKFMIVSLGALLLLFCLAQIFAAQNAADGQTLVLNREATFVLKDKESKTFYVELKKGDFTEIFYSDSLTRFPDYTLRAPSGRELTRDNYVLETMPFIAPEDGRYRLSVKFDAHDTATPEMTVTLRYSNVFKMPRSSKLVRQRKVAGYDVRVFNSTDEGGDYGSYLMIEKGGKLRYIVKGGSLVAGGFNFADDPTLFEFPEGKKSARLMRTTPDKTGDGTPDVAVQFYTGGAHCCIDVHFFELGAEIRKLRVVDGRDSDVLAVGKKPDGSLVLKTGDSNFAYWLTSFAGSPIPTVILSYRDGEFRPDAELMRKPAPSPAVLRRKAAAAKKHMNLKPYEDEESGDYHFTDAFWGEMLNLLYAGNEKAAWQYFDLVWDARKPGKEKFKQHFLSRLNESAYWRELLQDRK